MWKICENKQFWQRFGQISRNSPFPQNFHTRKLGFVFLCMLYFFSRQHHTYDHRQKKIITIRSYQVWLLKKLQSNNFKFLTIFMLFLWAQFSQKTFESINTLQYSYVNLLETNSCEKNYSIKSKVIRFEGNALLYFNSMLFYLLYFRISPLFQE